MTLGRAGIDAPFLWLLGAVNLFSLFFVTRVLVAQKHGDELNAPRDIRTLEPAILSEQKIAKVIQLLEGLRREAQPGSSRCRVTSTPFSAPPFTGK